MYCGAKFEQNGKSSDDAESVKQNAIRTADGLATIIIEETTDNATIERLAGLPEPMRRKAIEVLNAKGKDIKVDEQMAKQVHIDSKSGPSVVTVSIEESVTVLARVKRQFDTDRIDYDLYRQMVIETIKQYLEGLDSKTNLTFVANEIKQSEIFPYLDEDIHQELLKYAVAAAMEADDG